MSRGASPIFCLRRSCSHYPMRDPASGIQLTEGLAPLFHWIVAVGLAICIVQRALVVGDRAQWEVRGCAAVPGGIAQGNQQLQVTAGAARAVTRLRAIH